MSKKFFSCILIVFMMCFSISLFSQPKKRVAVFNFEDKTDHAWRWWDGRSPGDGVADMLTTALVKSGKYVVIERQQLEDVLNEQKLGQAGLVTEQSAAQVGKLLGVELAIVGAVTEFGHSKKDVGGSIKGFGLGVKSQKATVAVDVRFVNTTTGEILSAENVRKEESASGLRISTPEVGFRSQSDFDNSLVGKATRAAIEEIVELIDQRMDAVVWEGKIVKVTGSTVYMTPGSNGGVKVGDIYTVYSKGEVLIDPDTGLELDSIEEKIGTIEVTKVSSSGKTATATIKLGSGFKTGDMIRLK